MAASSPPVVVDLITPPSSPVAPVQDELQAAVPSLNLGASGIAAHGDYDSDVQEVAVPAAKRSCVEQSVHMDDDEEVEIVGSKGDNPLIDFPHLREHCLCHPFAKTDHAAFCKMCFCYVCDKPASECTDWTDQQHCEAISSVQAWKDARRSYGCELLKGMQGDHRKLARQVYRQMHSTNVKTPLNMAQTQMLAFCVDAEENGASTAVFAPQERFTSMPARVRGGIVASQVGMGKTGAICALMLERPAITLVVVKPLLVKQWMRQLAMFAPQLKAVALYAVSQKTVAEQIRLFDVVVVGSTSVLNANISREIERIVVDEAHDILGLHRVSSQVLTFLVRSHEYKVKYRWLVTGTPYNSFSDITFSRMASFLFSSPVSPVSLSAYATLSDLKGILIRIERDQKIKDDQGNEVVVANIPQLEYCTLECPLSPDEQILYEYAGCFDGWTQRPFSLPRGMEINSILKDRFRFRQLLLGEHFTEFQEAALRYMHDYMYCPDTMRVDEFYAVLNRMRYAMSELVERCKYKSTKYDMVIDEICKRRSTDPHYKAIVISQSMLAGVYMHSRFRKIGINVGNMQRGRGNNMLKMQDVLEQFQKGDIPVLVCAFEIVEIGVNLEEACELFFVDISLDDTQFEQACGRIQRFGVRHTQLKATCVYVTGTISEKIFKYHHRRRNENVSQLTAAQIFLPDNVHKYSEEITVHRVNQAFKYDDSEFSIHDRAPECVMSIFQDKDIDAAFEDAIGSYEPDTVDLNKKDVVWKLTPPACLDMAIHARLVLVDYDNFTIDFDVPKFDDLKVTLMATVIDLPVTHLSRSDNLLMQLVTPKGTYDMKHEISIVEHSCKCCSLCAFRKSQFKTIDTIGWTGTFMSMDKSRLSKEEAFQSVDHKGELTHRIKPDVFYDMRFFARMARKEREALELAKQCRPTCNTIHQSALCRKFFDMSPKHAKAFVMVGNDIKQGDTVGFRHKDTDYKVFVWKVDPAPAPTGGLAWWVTAFVQVDGPVSETILVQSSSKVS